MLHMELHSQGAGHASALLGLVQGPMSQSLRRDPRLVHLPGVAEHIPGCLGGTIPRAESTAMIQFTLCVRLHRLVPLGLPLCPLLPAPLLAELAPQFATIRVALPGSLLALLPQHPFLPHGQQLGSGCLLCFLLLCCLFGDLPILVADRFS